LPLIDAIVVEAGLKRSAIERIAVGVGPGSFTGLRVGIALAQGLGVGLGIDVFGIGSLQAMAAALPAASPGVRVPVLDARRGEVFVAGYAPEGTMVLSPCAIPREGLVGALAQLGPGAHVVLGEAAACLVDCYRSEETDLPDAAWTALVAARCDAPGPAAEPHYVRGPDVVLPDLPQAPLSVEPR